ncbi:hypothetical protein Golax_018098, partial [Gossypium laxum]|nr:hypothetical protein [Gossypium laxum]
MAKALESGFSWQVRDEKKVRIGVDRLDHELLPWIVKISSIKLNVEGGYLRCERREETAIDTLKDCPEAHVILAFGGLDGRILDNTYKRCIDWLEDALRLLDKKTFKDLITLLWNGWNCCNNAIFCGKNEETRVVLERSKTL